MRAQIASIAASQSRRLAKSNTFRSAQIYAGSGAYSFFTLDYTNFTLVGIMSSNN